MQPNILGRLNASNENVFTLFLIKDLLILTNCFKHILIFYGPYEVNFCL